MLPRNSNSIAKSGENPVKVRGRLLPPDRPDVVQQENTNSVTITDLHRQFKILDGSTGYGYDRVFAGCLDDTLKLVRVEDTYMFKKYQARNFDQFCKFLTEKCKKLERITLTTLPEDRNKNRVTEFDRVAEFNKIKNRLIKSGIAFLVEYKDFHDRNIYFDNGWRGILGRGLDYFKPPNTWPKGGYHDMNLRPCKETTITIFRDETNVKSETGTSSKHPDIDGPSVDDDVLEGINFTELLPPELTPKISWKSLYQEIFEYSLPLLHVGHGRFEFREPHDWPQPRFDKSIVVDPWEESFKQLKDGIHVRPGYASVYSDFGAGGRRLTQCDQLDQALQLIEARDENAEKLIFLHTGLYILETTVTINSNIQIIGASAGPSPGIKLQVTIEGRLDTTVTLAKGSQDAYLGWMTIRVAPDSGAVAAAIAAGNPPIHTYYCALQICGDSTALVEHCVVHSSEIDGTAVCVRGSDANPKMRHCVVYDCESVGIRITDAAQGQFEDCEIARYKVAGILVENRANPFFRRCHIHDGCHVGIFTSEHGMGYFESCNIHNNRSSGIIVENAANPTVTRCEVHHEESYGIYVREKGRGQFLENRIHSNALAGIEITSHSDPKIARNKIWGNQGGGVLIHSNGQGVLEDNEIFGNAKAGVWIVTNGNPTLRRNKIYNGLQDGVYISSKGRGVLEDNEVYGNTFTGIAVTTESSPIIRKNRIHSGKTGGVHFYDNGQGVLEDNEIFDNAMSGVWIYANGNPTLRRNKIYSGLQDGVYISNKGRGVLEDNEVYGNTFAGIAVTTGSSPIIRKNCIHSGKQGGVYFYDNGQGVLEDNEIFDNTMAGVCIKTDGNPTLRRNKIYDGRGGGVYIFNKGRGILEDNDIYRNAQAGVLILSESNPTLRRNRVYEGRTAGIEIRRGSMATLESNAIFHNRFGGLFLAPGVRPTLRDNKVYDNC